MKSVAEKIESLLRSRLKARTLRMFACACAKHVLPLYATHFPDDDRPWKAIRIAHRYALGKATQRHLKAAREMFASIKISVSEHPYHNDDIMWDAISAAFMATHPNSLHAAQSASSWGRTAAFYLAITNHTTQIIG